MLSIAIATMKRWDFLKESIPLYLEQDCVKEVVICDETGEDVDAISKSSFGTHPKLKLVKNEKRLGIYHNKRKAFSLATGPWVAILDSDNHFSEEWFEVLLKQDLSNPKMIYASADVKFVNTINNTMTQPLLQYSGMKVSKENWNSILTTSKWNWLLNDGNWVVHRSVLECLPTNVKELYAVDALYMTKKFIEFGCTVYYVPELSYLHIVHDGSSWLATDRESTHLMNTTNWTLL